MCKRSKLAAGNLGGSEASEGLTRPARAVYMLQVREDFLATYFVRERKHKRKSRLEWDWHYVHQTINVVVPPQKGATLAVTRVPVCASRFSISKQNYVINSVASCDDATLSTALSIPPGAVLSFMSQICPV